MHNKFLALDRVCMLDVQEAFGQCSWIYMILTFRLPCVESRAGLGPHGSLPAQENDSVLISDQLF